MTDVADDMGVIVDALTDVKYRYNEIGTQLHLRNLKEIPTTSNAIAMGGVIEEWLNKNYNTTRFGPPTWRMLVEVVANPNGGNNNALADKIAEEHPGLLYFIV